MAFRSAMYVFWAFLTGLCLIISSDRGLAAQGQTLGGQAAYQELLRVAPLGGIVEVDGQKYLRAPQSGQGLPGGYGGAFETKKVRLPNGQEVDVVDPAKRIAITPSGAAQPVADDRQSRAVALFEKMGLHPRVTPLPIAVGGEMIKMTIGQAAPGAIVTEMFVHVGDPARLRKLYDYSLDAENATIAKGNHRRLDAYCPAGWSGYSVTLVNRHNGKSGGSSEGIGGVNYMNGWFLAHCYKGGAFLSVRVRRIDTITFDAFYAGAPVNDTAKYNNYFSDHSQTLSENLKSRADSSMALLIDAMNKLDGDEGAATASSSTAPRPPDAGATTAVAPSTGGAEPSQSKPPAVAASQQPLQSAQASAPAKPAGAGDEKPSLTIRDLFPEKPGGKGASTVIGPHIASWLNEKWNWAAANPVKAAGSTMIAIGGALIATAAAPWTGVALVVGGIGAYQSTKPKPAPTELEVIQDARNKIQKFQNEWKQGFSNEELKELGIVFDDLSKLTKEQRMQVYRDADIEFQKRAEAYLYLKQEQEREKGGK